MKKLLAGLLVVVVVGAGIAYLKAGAIVKRGIESYGPRMLGAPVSVGLVTLSPFSGKATLRDLKIGNPEGFKSPSAIEVGDVSVEVDLKSLRSRKLIIDAIVVDDPRITVETGKGGTNLQALQRNLAKYAPANPKEEKTTEGRKVEIGVFRLRGAKATAVLSQLKDKSYALSLPAIELRDIGSKSGGATAAEATRQVLSAITSASIQAAGGPKALLEKGLKSLGDDGSEAVERVRGLIDR
jgi:hypothetical protein